MGSGIVWVVVDLYSVSDLGRLAVDDAGVVSSGVFLTVDLEAVGGIDGLAPGSAFQVADVACRLLMTLRQLLESLCIRRTCNQERNRERQQE